MLERKDRLDEWQYRIFRWILFIISFISLINFSIVMCLSASLFLACLANKPWLFGLFDGGLALTIALLPKNSAVASKSEMIANDAEFKASGHHRPGGLLNKIQSRSTMDSGLM